MEVSSARRPSEKRSAFEAVTLPLMTIVYNRALHLTRNADVAGDLVQETYLRAFRTFDNFAAGTNAKAWLLTILYSVFVSRYRQQKRRPEEISLEDAERAYSDLLAAESGPVAPDPKLWASSEVLAALERLPKAFQAVLLMVDVDELSYEETAAALRCPVGTVRSRLSRARRLLYADLQQFARAHGFARQEP